MKQNILLISRDVDEAKVIVDQLSVQKNFKVFLEKNAKSVLSRLKETPIHAMVMNLEYFGMNQLNLIEQIRAFKFKFKIIVIANRVQTLAHASIESVPNVVILGKTYMDLGSDFAGFFKRALTSEKIPKRTAKRHLAKQPAIVKSVGSGETFNCTVFNLSTTGAYLQFERGHLNINDKVQIIIPLSQINKTHAITCQIAWLQIDSSGKRSAGLKFSSRALSAR